MKRHRLSMSSLPVSPSVRALNPELFRSPASADGLVLTLAGYLPATPNTLRGKHWSVVQKEKTRATLALSRALIVAGIIPGDTPRILWATHSDSPTRRKGEQGTTVMFRRVPEWEELLPWYPRCAAQGGS